VMQPRFYGADRQCECVGGFPQRHFVKIEHRYYGSPLRRELFQCIAKQGDIVGCSGMGYSAGE